jgi:hypothetical protein
MSTTRDTGFLRNAVQVTNQGIVFVSGSTLLMSISSSGAVTTTGVISGSNALSASYSISSSYSVSSSYAYTASSAVSASYVLNAISASYAYTASSTTNATSASKAVSSSYSDTASFANNFTVLGNLTVFGTQSVQYITSSQLNVSDNVITVNVASPGVRFGGLSVFDSGSLSSEATASLFWDSQENHWIYQRESGSTYNGGMLISGPRNFAGLGNEQGTTSGSLMKGQGGDHVTSSAIFEDGYKATFYNNSLVVSSSGFVGIGTTNPTSSLDVSGSVYIRSSSGGVLYIPRLADPSHGLSIGEQNIIGSKSAVIRTAGGVSEHLFIDPGSNDSNVAGNIALAYANTGSVGIGTFLPDTLLTAIGKNGNLAKFKTNNSTDSYNAGIILAGNANSVQASRNAYILLDPNGANGTGQDYAFFTALGSGETQFGTSKSDGFLALYTADTERMRITSAGVTAIAASSNTSDLGSTGLVIGGSSTLTSGNVLMLNFTPIGHTSNRARAGIGCLVGADWGKGNLTFYTQDASSGAAMTTGNERMRITSDGYVAIGNTSPVSRLTVNNAVVGATLPYINGTGLSYNSEGISVAGSNTNNTNVGNGLTLYNNVASVGAYSPVIAFSSMTSGGAYNATYAFISGVYRGAGGDTNWGIGDLIFGTGASYGATLRMTISSAGNIGAPSGTNIYNASDARLKQNVTTITNGLDKVMGLNPVKFNWINNFVESEEGKDMLGFVAQEVQTVIPEAVENFSDNSIKVGETIVENPLRVNEKFIIPVLVKAIQELKLENDCLKEILQRNNIN